MQPSRLALLCTLSLLAAVPACPSTSTPVAETKAKAGDARTADAKAAGDAKVVHVEGPVNIETPAPADGGPSPQEVAEAGAAMSSPPMATEEPDKALGAQFVDPRWFRKAMFGERG
jgi:hypothetical protein